MLKVGDIVEMTVMANFEKFRQPLFAEVVVINPDAEIDRAELHILCGGYADRRRGHRFFLPHDRAPKDPRSVNWRVVPEDELDNVWPAVAKEALLG